MTHPPIRTVLISGASVAGPLPSPSGSAAMASSPRIVERAKQLREGG